MQPKYSNHDNRSPRNSGSSPDRRAGAPGREYYDPGYDDINMGRAFRSFWAGLKMVWTALKYRLFKLNGGGKTTGYRIPWLKVGFVCIVVFLVTQKDIRFSINLKAPLAQVRTDREKPALRTAGVDKLSLGDGLPFGGGAKKEEKTVRVEDLDPASVEVYVRRFSRVAVAEMRKFGMPASIKLALGILESRAGDGVDPQDNNHFGAPLAGESYVSAWENWRAHSLLMKRNYADLFDNAYGYKQWAKGLAQKGYSADRKYADRLISIVEKYQLHLYDE